jgi:hypothetical protein
MSVSIPISFLFINGFSTHTVALQSTGATSMYGHPHSFLRIFVAFLSKTFQSRSGALSYEVKDEDFPAP